LCWILRSRRERTSGSLAYRVVCGEEHAVVASDSGQNQIRSCQVSQ
jgi:hypothetical protein